MAKQSKSNRAAVNARSQGTISEGTVFHEIKQDRGASDVPGKCVGVVCTSAATLSTLHYHDSFLAMPREIHSTNLVGIRFHSSNSKPRYHSHFCLNVQCTSCRWAAWAAMYRCRQDIERKTAPQSGIQNIETFGIIHCFQERGNSAHLE